MNVISSFEKIEDLQAYHDSSLDFAVKSGLLLKVDNGYMQYVYQNINSEPECFANVELYWNGQIDIQEFQKRITLFILAKDSSIEEYSSLVSDPTKYIFIGSKTWFRKINHTNMIDSLYKKYYNLLKAKNVISLANGSLVIISDYTFTSEDFNVLSKSEPSKETLKSINDFFANYEESKNALYNSFYRQSTT